jgi:hypothetical protein
LRNQESWLRRSPGQSPRDLYAAPPSRRLGEETWTSRSPRNPLKMSVEPSSRHSKRSV